MTQQSGNSFSAFKTSHDLKIIELSVPIQSSKRPPAHSGLRPPRARRPGSHLFHITEGAAASLREAPPAAPYRWAWQCSALRLGQQEAGDPHLLAAALITEKHPSSQGGRPGEVAGVAAAPCAPVSSESKIIKSGRPASQPANCQQCSFLRNQNGVGHRGQDAGTHRDRGGCTQMHMNTRAHTYQNEHAWAVTCARTHWYLSTSQSQIFSFFFFKFFLFCF